MSSRKAISTATVLAWFLLLSSCLVGTWAFAPPLTTTTTISKMTTTESNTYTRLFLSSEDKSSPSKAPFDESLRSKLVSEAIAPWRTVRLFFYGTLGAGALIGGIITLTGTLAALQGARPDLELTEQYTNLAIDFGAVATFGALAKWDIDKGKTLDNKVVDKIEATKQKKVQQKSLAAREQTLGTLELDIVVGPDRIQRAAVRELQAGAKQHVIVVIGPRKATRDALIGANLLKMDFAMSNVLVVPYEIDVDAVDEATRPTGTGFGDSRPVYETQPYVARADGEGWADWCAAEMADAVGQNGETARTEGIAIVVANTGKVIRRGVGKVPWRQMVEQLEAEASGTTSSSSSGGGFF